VRRPACLALWGVRLWHDEAVGRHLVTIDGSSASADRATIERLLAEGTLLWLDLYGPDNDDLVLLHELFGVHPLALRGVAEFGQRPKADGYGDVTYLVAYGVRSFAEPLVEVHCLYSERFLVTARCEPCLEFDELRRLLESGGQPGFPGLPQLGEPPQPGEPGGHRPVRLALLHHVLDSLFASFFPALSDFDDRIDALQERIFARPTDEELVAMFSMQRWLVSLRKLVTSQRDMLASLASGMVTLPGMTPAGSPYVRSLYDHLIRVSDLVDSYRDLLSNAMGAYLSTVSNRLNSIMKQLTVIATVFLPLSFLTGFFGQNFGWMQDHLAGLAAFLIFGLGLEALVVSGLFLLFRRRRWI
jgi:magnesium transporter